MSITLSPTIPAPTITFTDLEGAGNTAYFVIIPATSELVFQLTTVLKGDTGPRGPQGPPGDQGATGFTPLEFVASSPGAQTCTCVHEPSVNTQVFINGIRQSASSFTLGDMLVFLPDTLNITVGDLVQLEY